MTIGQRIAFLRKKSGMTQAELAEELDMKQARVAFIEKKEGEPTIQQLQKLIKIFNTSYEYLIDGKESKDQTINKIKKLAQELNQEVKKL